MGTPENTTYDPAPGYTLSIDRRLSFEGRRRWQLLGPLDTFTGLRPIVGAGEFNPQSGATPAALVAFGFMPEAARLAFEALERSIG